MSALLQAFHFLHPAWLLALLLLPLLIWWRWRQSDGAAQLGRVADAELLPLLLAPSPVTRRGSLWLVGLLWLLACVALAGPAWQRLPTPAAQGPDARVIVLSLADSMLATDLKPDRLTRARFKIRDLLQSGGDAQNALVAYAGEAFVVAPLTTDIDTVLNFLSDLKPDVMPVAGDAADKGIDKAVKLLQQADFNRGDIILVADQADDPALQAARRAYTQGFHVSVLGVGTSQGSPVALPGGGFLTDAKGNIVIPKLALGELHRLAAAGGGVFQQLSVDDHDVHALLRASHHPAIATPGKDSKNTVERWRDEGPWLLLLLVPLAALGFRRGWLMLLAATLLLPVGPAHAAQGWWSQLWHNQDQQAAQALARGKPEQALKQARTPGLRGSAAYRDGDFRAAAQNFAQGHDARSQYNLGNALARQGEYEKAIQAWDRALKMEPALDDARANRKAVEDWLKKQKKKPDSSRSGDQSSNQQHKPGDKGQSGQQGKQGRNQGSNEPSRNHAAPQSDSGKSKSETGKQDAHNDSESQGQASNPSSPGSASAPAQARSVTPAPALSSEAPPQAPSAQEAERQRRQGQQARQALGEEMDKALQQERALPVHRLGQDTREHDDKLSPSMRQALDRVPDDPGGLLRRKFMLQYQQQKQREEGS